MSITSRVRALILPGALAALLILVWELAVRTGYIPRFLLAAPSDAITYITSHQSVVIPNFSVTVYEVMLGLAAGAFGGVALGSLVFYNETIRKIIYPLLVALQVIPKVAIAPFLLLWFGFGIFPKIIITTLMSFFPIVLNTLLGLTSVEPEIADMGRSLHAPAWRMFSKIYLMNALPHILTGLKTASTFSVIGAVVGEFIGGTAGLGYLIIMGLSYGETTMMVAALLLLFIMGILLFVAIDVVERVAIRWYYLEREER